jgi:hypothetical protein
VRFLIDRIRRKNSPCCLKARCRSAIASCQLVDPRLMTRERIRGAFLPRHPFYVNRVFTRALPDGSFCVPLTTDWIERVPCSGFVFISLG